MVGLKIGIQNLGEKTSAADKQNLSQKIVIEPKYGMQ
jgi:hypothetical protein